MPLQKSDTVITDYFYPRAKVEFKHLYTFLAFILKYSQLLKDYESDLRKNVLGSLCWRWGLDKYAKHKSSAD